ncbi:MAG: phosphoenolpyruvate--protein phosphotransferase, partial [Micromonosporaceae bacterium]
PAAGVAEDAGTGPAAAVTDVFVLHNEHGLHARPAAKLVAAIRRLDAAVTLRNLTTGTAPVPADSLSRVSTLGASRGHRIEVAASGGHAREAIEHVLALASRHFDEAPDAGTPAPVVPTPPAAGTPAPSVGASTSAAALPGAAAPSAAASPGAPGGVGAGRQAPLPAAPGIALGPARHPVLGDVDVPDRTPGDPATEWAQLQEAVETVRRETVRLRARTAVELGESEAAIFDAHLMLLDDADLVDQLRRGIDAGQAAEVAWANVLRQLEDRMAGLADPYQRARAADVRGVADQVLRTLLGVPASAGSRDGVLVAADLTPAESANLDPEAVRGVALAYGSPTAHSAILARTRGIPMIVAAGPDVLSVPDGTILAFDGGTGELVIDPDRRTRDRFSERAEARSRAEAAARASAGGPARTADGVSIEVAANVGSLADATLAHSSGADAAGLVRTEFLFLDRATAPDIDEQEAAYRSLADALGGRRLTLRTFDVGGDKPLPYLPSATEANPFLGLRGIRLALSRRELLRDQLVAACRVARDAPVSLMFPMVSTVDELIAARGVLDEALATIGGPRPSGLRVGIMVEVPAAALKAAAFVPYVDFFSVGTNDLTQYTLAAERGNDAVARLADPLDPAVLRLIDLTCRAAAGRVEVGVCGEVAADDAAVPFLVGLGVRELSVAPAAVPMVKQAVRQVDTAAAARLARQAVDAARAEDVRALLAAG